MKRMGWCCIESRLQSAAAQKHSARFHTGDLPQPSLLCPSMALGLCCRHSWIIARHVISAAKALFVCMVLCIDVTKCHYSTYQQPESAFRDFLAHGRSALFLAGLVHGRFQLLTHGA